MRDPRALEVEAKQRPSLDRLAAERALARRVEAAEQTLAKTASPLRPASYCGGKLVETGLQTEDKVRTLLTVPKLSLPESAKLTIPATPRFGPSAFAAVDADPTPSADVTTEQVVQARDSHGRSDLSDLSRSVTLSLGTRGAASTVVKDAELEAFLERTERWRERPRQVCASLQDPFADRMQTFLGENALRDSKQASAATHGTPRSRVPRSGSITERAAALHERIDRIVTGAEGGLRSKLIRARIAEAQAREDALHCELQVREEARCMASELHAAEARIAKESAWVYALADAEAGADRAARATRMLQVESELQNAEAAMARVEATTEAARAELRARNRVALLTEEAQEVAAEPAASHDTLAVGYSATTKSAASACINELEEWLLQRGYGRNYRHGRLSLWCGGAG